MCLDNPCIFRSPCNSYYKKYITRYISEDGNQNLYDFSKTHFLYNSLIIVLRQKYIAAVVLYKNRIKEYYQSTLLQIHYKI